eukprot:jgi/Chlat1/9246/Chrsp99S08518
MLRKRTGAAVTQRYVVTVTQCDDALQRDPVQHVSGVVGGGGGGGGGECQQLTGSIGEAGATSGGAPDSIEIEGIKCMLANASINQELAKGEARALSWAQWKVEHRKLASQRSKALGNLAYNAISTWRWLEPVLIANNERLGCDGVHALGLLCVCGDVHTNVSNIPKLRGDHFANACKGISPSQHEALVSAHASIGSCRNCVIMPRKDRD